MRQITALLIALLCLSNVAFSQTIWTLAQDKKYGSLELTQSTLPYEDSIPDRRNLRTIPLNDIPTVDDPVNADVAVDRFHNSAIIAVDHSLWSVNLDSLETTEIPLEGDKPFSFDTPFRGIDIIYGVNNRPKWLLCASWNEYSYIDMRSTPWRWGHAAWIIPNGGFPVDDIEFCIQDRYEGEQPIKLGLAYTIEYGGLISVWNPIEAIKGRTPQGLLYHTGTGQFGSRLVFDTSSPVHIQFSQAGTRDLSGRLWSMSEEFVLRDVNHTGGGLVEYDLSGSLMGLDFSPDPIDLSEYVGFRGVGAPDLLVRFSGDSDQPLMEQRPSASNNLLVTTQPYKGTPYLYYTVNYEHVRYNGTGQTIKRPSLKLGWQKAIFNSQRGEYYVSLRDTLPRSPLPPDTRMYIYAQWAWVPNPNQDFVNVSEIAFSAPVLLPISNVQ